MRRAILDAVRKERGNYSNNELARRLQINKKELLKAYKILDREGPEMAENTDQNCFSSDHLFLRVGRFFVSPIRMALFIFFLALAFRLAALSVFYDDPLLHIPILDAGYYSQWAEKILSGESYPPNAFFTEPGYAYLVALFYSIFGVSSLPIVLFQMLLGSVAAVCLFFSVLRCTGDKLAASIVGIGAALFSVTIFYDLLLLKTSVEFFLLSVGILALTAYRERLTPVSASVLGALTGLTALIKANMLYILPLLLGAFLFGSKPFFEKRKMLIVSIIVVGASIFIVPITVRNFLLSDAFVPINSSGGANLYIGNWEGADGTLKPPEYISTIPTEEENDWHRVAENYTKRHLNPAEVSSFWSKKAFEEIITHPLVFLGNVSWKTFLLLNARTLGDDYDREYAIGRSSLFFVTVPDVVVLVMGIFGMVCILITRKKRLFYAPYLIIAIGYATTLVLSHVTDRYRVALLPFFFLFSGVFLVWIREQLYERDFGKIALVASGAVGLALFLLIPPKGISGTTVSDMFVNFGAAYEERGAREQALAMYEKSFASDEKHIPTLGKLARLELEAGHIGRAIDLYRRALFIQTEFPAEELYLALDAESGKIGVDDLRERLREIRERPQSNERHDINAIEGLAAVRKREYEKAIPFLELAMNSHPQSVSVFSNMATAYKNTNQPEKAKKIFEKLLQEHPYALQARFNYANLLSAEKNSLGAAIVQYEEINRVVPGYYVSRYFLGEAYAKTGQLAKAKTAFERFIEEAAGDPAKQSFVVGAREALKKLAQ